MQLGEIVLAGDDLREVGPHPGLVGDDKSITGVGLGLSWVGVARAVHSQARKVVNSLLSLPQQRQHKRHGAYLADKGFTGVEWERLWLEVYGALVAAVPKNNSRRAWSKADRRWASGKRQVIEGVICQLKDFFGLERHRAKTLGGLLTRLAAKIAA